MATGKTAASAKPKKAGKKPMTEAEKEAKKAFLKAEGKDAKFKRLAKPRVETAIAKIALVGNCAGAGYDYNQTQIDTIRAALTDAVETTMAKFDVTVKTPKAEISL